MFQVPYLGLYIAQDFAQILYFVGGVRIINRNNVHQCTLCNPKYGTPDHERDFNFSCESHRLHRQL